jgi:hypothetical protein
VIPEELNCREERLAAIEQAKAAIQERFEREQADYEQKVARREAYEAQTGQKARGKAPSPPKPGPQPKDQVHLKDADSRIMPSSRGGFE